MSQELDLHLITASKNNLSEIHISRFPLRLIILMTRLIYLFATSHV